MAWPTQKASTENVDQASDRIEDGRSEINQNIDNINEIIDHFDISTAEENQIIKYDGVEGKWKNVNAVVDFVFVYYTGYPGEQEGFGLYDATGLVQNIDSAQSTITVLPGYYVLYYPNQQANVNVLQTYTFDGVQGDIDISNEKDVIIFRYDVA